MSQENIWVEEVEELKDKAQHYASGCWGVDDDVPC